APLSPEQVKTLRGMLPENALELEAIKARLDVVNEIIDKRLWEFGDDSDRFWHCWHEMCGTGPYDGAVDHDALFFRHLLAATARYRCNSREGPFSFVESGHFQTEIYRELIHKSIHLSHKRSTGCEFCDGGALLERDGETIFCRLREILPEESKLTGAQQFDHVLQFSGVMRYIKLL
ncbi:hypothetical protein QBC45DRAFT_289099, partial [Copromyces sp. CBS 386.78]